MAYSVCDETQLNNPKTVQYYPEEYDYPSYYHKVSELRVTYPTIQNVKKAKKPMASINYINEKKCPIYVHQFNKIQSVSTCNNYPCKPIKGPQEKRIGTKKMPNFSTTRSVLDQLEETYWATWKPNRDTLTHIPKRNRSNEGKMNKNIAYGDVGETLVNYFARKNKISDASVIEDDEKYGRTMTNLSELHAPRRNNGRLSITATQEIQTDAYPLILPQKSTILPTAMESKSAEITIATVIDDDKAQPEQSAATSKNTVAEVNILEEEVTEKEAMNSEQETNKLLKHTDSFIIIKKRQSEVKKHFQQPTCIRLYRKPGYTASFIKGGSYPLKSCLKKEAVEKGNFRLGAPGSPLFVTTSSYNKKSRK